MVSPRERIGSREKSSLTLFPVPGGGAVNTLRLALRMLRRDWRAGELRVLVAALILAVASVGTVGFFADRVKGALTRQANLLLGGDLMITGDRPLPPGFAERARADGLASTPVIRFNSMVQRASRQRRPRRQATRQLPAPRPS